MRLPGQVDSQGLEVPGSLLLGTVCCIQDSHVSSSCDQVDDTDDRLQQSNGGSDPETHSEETHRANCGKGARATQRKWDAGEEGAQVAAGFISLGRPEPPPILPSSHIIH